MSKTAARDVIAIHLMASEDQHKLDSPEQNANNIVAALDAAGFVIVPKAAPDKALEVCMLTGGEPYRGPSKKVLATMYELMIREASQS